jgi:hypothetical protein
VKGVIAIAATRTMKFKDQIAGVHPEEGVHLGLTHCLGDHLSPCVVHTE